jgi:peptidylprolyl isomerase
LRRALTSLAASALLAAPATVAVAFGGSLFPASASAAARPAAAVLPRVAGGFGHTPSIAFPPSRPPTSLVSRVLHAGHGPTVRSGDLVSVAYTGQIWRGKVFDSTFLAKFGHRSPFVTPIGEGKVVKGWDDGLPGARVGSRVLLVIPPKWGYGSAGAPSAGITGSDTLVFVVDVLASWGKGASSGGRQSMSATRGGVTVSGALDRVPHVHVPSSARPPKHESRSVLVRGSGARVGAGTVVFEEYVTDWRGKTLASTWSQSAPQSYAVTASNDPFAGIPVGSRVLFLEPKTSQGGPYVVVVDLVADIA